MNAPVGSGVRHRLWGAAIGPGAEKSGKWTCMDREFRVFFAKVPVDIPLPAL